MSFRSKTSEFISRVRASVKSPTGKDILLYLCFVAVAFAFWLLLSLDNEVQRDFDIPVELHDVPDSVTIVSGVPPTLTVSVKGKGSQLVRYIWGGAPALKIKFAPTQGRTNQVFVNRAGLDRSLREYFGSGVTIASVKPDSIKVLFTSLPGHRVKLVVDARVTPDIQYMVSGPVTANVDSVLVYSATPLPKDMTVVKTEPIVREGLKDTTRMEVRVQPVVNMRIVPDMVKVTIPIEPLIAKKRTVPVEVLNVPGNKNVVVFPSVIEVSYLVPMSRYSTDYQIKAYVDYKEIVPERKKVPVGLSLPPAEVSNLTTSVDSVEYIIENEAL